MWVSFQYTLVYDCVQSLKLKNAWNLINRLKSLKWMSYYLNTFKFPGENMNQSDYGNYGDYGSTEIMQQNLCKKVTGKKVSGKKAWGKKSPNFWSPRTKCHWK